MRKLYALMALAAVLAAGCAKEQGPDPNQTLAGSEFDYASKKIYSLDIDYRLNGYATPVVFEVYAEDPFTSVSRSTLKDIEPMLRAFADETGNFSGTIEMPSGLGKVYLYTRYLGAPTVVELQVSGNSVRFDQDVVTRSATRASTAAGYQYPDDISVLGGWDILGVPSYLGKKENIPTALLREIMDILKDGQSAVTAYPDLFTGNNKAIEVVRADNKSIKMVFAHDGCSYRNAVGYYTYDKNNPPKSPSDIKKILAFPNASFKNDGGGLLSGDMIRLQYWNPSLNGGQGGYQDEFPLGTMIAFFYLPDGFDAATGNIPAKEAFYSNNEVVAGHLQQMVAFRPGNRELLVVGLEDKDRRSDSDNDFNDVIFYLEGHPVKSIDIPTPPPTPDPTPDPEEVSTTYKGTLIFEDLWPYRGDYDINDIVLEYTCTVWSNRAGTITRVQDSFTPVNNGAQIQSGFAYQYGVAPSRIASVSGSKTTGTVIPNKGNYKPIPWETDGLGFETGQSLAVRMLFDDIRTVVDKDRSFRYDYVTTFKQEMPVTIAELGYPPYNPFIMIVYPQDDEVRGRELHLASHTGRLFPPTDKANPRWFNYGHDKSIPAQGIYYLSTDSYPFAIDVPVHGFKLTAEKEAIDVLYPQFRDWAASKGLTNRQWYMHPAR